MPLYEYKCNNCQFEWEEVKKIAERYDVQCPTCDSKDVKLLISAVHKDWFKPFWHEDLSPDGPVFVKSKSHYKELCKKYGVYAPHVFGQGWNLEEV